jgi:hypothetical protein
VCVCARKRADWVFVAEERVTCCGYLKTEKKLKSSIRQAMYVQRNIEARPRDNCCSRKAINVTYSECVLVAFVIQHGNAHASYCHLWPSRLYSIFPLYLIKGTIFEKK